MSSSILARCGRHALASRPQLAPATVHFVRFGSGSASSDKKDPPTPQFGKKVVEDDNSQAQLMHDITKGKFEYIGDFAASLNKGPVKLDYGKEAKPLSEKERLQDELNEANLKLIQRSLIIGSLAAAGGCYLGWVVTKWYYGVRNMNEFSDVMKEKMPKVSGSMEDSMIGRKLKEQSEHSRDAISENAELTDWRRSLRGKFNTEEGARIARQNSIAMAEKREQERVTRKSQQKPDGSIVAVKELDETSAIVVAAADAEGGGEGGAEESAAAPAVGGTIRTLQRRTTQVLQDVESGVLKGGSTAVSSGAELVRSTSRVLNTGVKSLKTYVSQNLPAASTEAPPPPAEPKQA